MPNETIMEQVTDAIKNTEHNPDLVNILADVELAAKLLGQLYVLVQKHPTLGEFLARII